MKLAVAGGFELVNRHTGGLETLAQSLPVGSIVNRHTGGLENKLICDALMRVVNRHTGGLET